MAIAGNWTFGGDHFVGYTDAELQCGRPETHTMLNMNFTSIKKKKEKD